LTDDSQVFFFSNCTINFFAQFYRDSYFEYENVNNHVNNVFFFNEAVTLSSNKSAFKFCKVTKRAKDIQDNVYLTSADNRYDLVRRIVAVCEQTNTTRICIKWASVEGVECALERMEVISNICYSKVMVT
jgi:hypothetical protein